MNTQSGNQSNEEPQSEKKAEDSSAAKGHSLFGPGSFGLGVVLLGISAGLPIYCAYQKDPQITTFPEMVGISLICIIAGINGMLFGEKAYSWIPRGEMDLKDIKGHQWLMLAINVAIVVAAILLLNNYLAGLGYSER